MMTMYRLGWFTDLPKASYQVDPFLWQVNLEHVAKKSFCWCKMEWHTLLSTSRLFPCLWGVFWLFCVSWANFENSLIFYRFLLVIWSFEDFVLVLARLPRQTSFARSNALTQGMPSLHQAAKFGRVDTSSCLCVWFSPTSPNMSGT